MWAVTEGRLVSFIDQVMCINRRAAKDVQLPTGYSSVADEVGALVASFLRLVSYNQAVFGSYYHDIIATVQPAATASH